MSSSTKAPAVLKHYLGRMKHETTKHRLIKRQAVELFRMGVTQCGCGQTLNALNSFRCLYCGVFLCVKCAEAHFGVTREQYDKGDQ